MTNIPLYVDDDIDEVRRLASRLTPVCDEMRALRRVATAVEEFLAASDKGGNCWDEMQAMETALKEAGRG